MSCVKLLQRVCACAAALFLIAGCTPPGGLGKRLHVIQSVSQLKDGDAIDITERNPGEQVDVKRYLSSRKYTVVEFTSEY